MPQNPLSARTMLFLAAVVCAGLLALISFAISFAQTLSPGEVRISSGPYAPPAAALRVQTNEVQVGVVVRDGKGKVVSGLKQEDFAIYDDGKEQAISSFSVETRELRVPAEKAAAGAPEAAQPNLPAEAPRRARYVALYFDDLNTQFGDMRHVQLAAENFIRTGVSPGDQIALFTASGLVSIDFSANGSGIIDAIEKLRFRGRPIESSGCPRITPYDVYEIANEPEPPIGSGLLGSPTYVTIVLEAVKCNCYDETNLDPDCVAQQEQIVQAESKQMWDSIRQMSQDTLNTVQADVNYLAKKPGERVLVLSSSGFLTGTMETDVDNLVTSALRAGVVINALDAKGLYTGMATMDPQHGWTDDLADNVAVHDLENFGPAMSSAMGAMVDFAVGTGGRYFHNRNDLAAGYYSLAAAPETEYLLGFAPEKENLNGKFHKLKVEVKAAGKFDVQARPGYFATKESSEEAAKEPAGKAAPPTAEEKIDAEVHGSEERSDFPLSVSAEPRTASDGSREVRVQTHVDIQKLPFDVQQDRHVDMLTFVTVLLDAQGKIVTGKEAQMQLALNPESFERFSKSGISGGMSLEAPAGEYRLRVVVEEALHGEMSATTKNVQIQ
ncbi:MAG: VWA domain-containing protein [Candidatus Acidiferrales bacterium]